jgi:hypothetical protein
LIPTGINENNAPMRVVATVIVSSIFESDLMHNKDSANKEGLYDTDRIFTRRGSESHQGSKSNSFL